MAKTTFTEKMLLEEVIANPSMSAAAKEKANVMLEGIIRKAANRKTSEKAVAKAAVDAELRKQVLEVMEKGKTYAANEITTLINKTYGGEYTVNKIGNIAKNLATEGKLTQNDGRFNGRPVKVYTLA